MCQCTVTPIPTPPPQNTCLYSGRVVVSRSAGDDPPDLGSGVLCFSLLWVRPHLRSLASYVPHSCSPLRSQGPCVVPSEDPPFAASVRDSVLEAVFVFRTRNATEPPEFSTPARGRSLRPTRRCDDGPKTDRTLPSPRRSDTTGGQKAWKCGKRGVPPRRTRHGHDPGGPLHLPIAPEHFTSFPPCLLTVGDRFRVPSNLWVKTLESVVEEPEV